MAKLLSNRIHKRKYEAPQSRRVFIPKTNGDKRPLSIGNVVDRGIQGALREVLEQLFWFRPKRSAHNALATLNHGIRNENLKYFLEVDLENFFGTIIHRWPMKFLGHRISDKRVLTVIKSWLEAGIIEEGKVIKNDVGAAQGGSISPLLANIYLHYVLDIWFEKKIKPRMKGRSRLIRYADDFVVSFENENDCTEFKALLNARLNYFGMPGNGSYLVRFRSMVMKLRRRMLSRRSQVSKVSWDEMDRLNIRLEIVPMKI
jgi:group II intron reverse transcriptase/maturase